MGNKAPHDHIAVNSRDKYPTELVQNLLLPSLGDRQKPSNIPEKTPRESYPIATFTGNPYKDIIRNSEHPCCPGDKNMTVNTS